MRRKFLFVDSGYLFKPKKYPWYQCYPLLHWKNEDIKIYLRKHIPGYNIDAIYEKGCMCCGTDIKFYPNNLKRLYDTDKKKWLYYMRCGMGEQILKANGIPGNKLEKILNEKPEILLQVLR